MGVSELQSESKPATAAPVAPTARARRRSAREQAIIEAARQIMAETGYAAMTMDDLAARANISKPTLYQYFPSKEAVAVQAIIGMMQESHTYLVGLDANLSALTRLTAFIDWIVKQRFSPCRAAFGAVKTSLAPVVQAHPEYRYEFERMVAAASDLVDEAKREGTVAPDLCTRIIVQIVFSMMRDAEYDLLVSSGESNVQEIVQTLSALYLRGIRPAAESQPFYSISSGTTQRGAADFTSVEATSNR